MLNRSNADIVGEEQQHKQRTRRLSMESDDHVDEQVDMSKINSSEPLWTEHETKMLRWVGKYLREHKFRDFDHRFTDFRLVWTENPGVPEDIPAVPIDRLGNPYVSRYVRPLQC